jgi:CheY-like chemotaxis protein
VHPPPTSDQDARAEINKLKSEFLASLNHEIRTPLSGIVGMMDLLEETGLSAEQREYVAAARMCAEDLLRHLNTALEYSSLAAGQLKLDEVEFNLAECVRSAVEQHRQRALARGIVLDIKLEGQFPGLVIGDLVRVRDIFWHLIDNALKFTHRGRVSITAECTNGASPPCLVATIRDTGIGIPPEHFRAIFDSFHQIDHGLGRRYAGLGLGLAFVQRLVGFMGGKIDVESRPGDGSAFRVMLPLKPAPETAMRGAPAAEDSRVLVVEDDELGRRIASHILRRAGYTVEVVSDGESGIAAAATRRPALVLMDLEMPGLGGIEATRAIRALPGRESVPVVALTAHTGAEYREECLTQGMNAFLSKPVSPEDLLAAVRDIIGPPPARLGR